MRKKNITNNNSDLGDLKDTTANLFINVVIFILAGIVIVMIWSIYKKLATDDINVYDTNDENVPAEIIQVEVLNGCGVTGVADRFTDFLRANNVDVVKTDNYVTFDIDETMVIDRTGNLANAKTVAEMLGMKRNKAFQQQNSDYFVDVTVIIGRDYFSLKPLN
ncbi:MAG: LytR C-terminal domain-containing protein [Melioribacteraceae bacterium]|nr:LytR C-terminal domain-containing protein [Melioribacteraceae bacterium]